MILQIVSIGPGDPSLLNQKTEETLRTSGFVVLRTGRHPLSAWLEEQEISFCTMDDLYETSDDFELLSESIARRIWELASQYENMVYAVSDQMTDHTVDAVFAARPENSRIVLIPGFSFADYYLSACREYFSTSDIRICPAASFTASGYDPSRALLITELNDEITAGEIKNRLSFSIRDEETVVFLDGKAVPRQIPLYELDRQAHYDHLSAVAAGPFPYEKRSRKTLEDLMRIMDRLRSADGCPWDKAQTHESLKPYVVEEAWEVVDAIQENNPDHLAEELGDLLFQVAFHTSIGQDFDEFTLEDVVGNICEKMIRRHPHVFEKTKNNENGDLPETFTKESWDRIKQAEKGRKNPVDALTDVSTFLPSLRYAAKILRKLDGIPGVKIPARDEVLSSIRQISSGINDADCKEKLGTLLLLCVQLSCSLGIDSEILLHQTVKKMIDLCQSHAADGKKEPDSFKPLTFKDLGVY